MVLFQDSKQIEKVDIDDVGVGVGASGDMVEASNVADDKVKIDVDGKPKISDKSDSGKLEDSASTEALKHNPLLAQVRSVPESLTGFKFALTSAIGKSGL